jgi:hypothetical protein
MAAKISLIKVVRENSLCRDLNVLLRNRIRFGESKYTAAGISVTALSGPIHRNKTPVSLVQSSPAPPASRDRDLPVD